MTPPDDEALRTAEAIRAALLRAAREGYERAAMSGLCAEGALEAAISAMQQVDLRRVLTEQGPDRSR